jgi:hypothetical protein
MTCAACNSDNQRKFEVELELRIYADPTRSAMPIEVKKRELLVCLECGTTAPFFSNEELTLLRKFGGSSSLWL